jgi:hypothetical protein
MANNKKDVQEKDVQVAPAVSKPILSASDFISSQALKDQREIVAAFARKYADRCLTYDEWVPLFKQFVR